MSGPVEPSALPASVLTATVELKGHLIDSLTLSKVVDLIQQLGGDYLVNDLRVGNLKKDISFANMTLWAPTEAVMAELLEAIAPYGAVASIAPENPKTVTCTAAGSLPDGAFAVKLPQQVFMAGAWHPVASGGLWALVLTDGAPRMVSVRDLQPGDILVSGSQGLQW